MDIWRHADNHGPQPEGHYGGVTAADILTKARTGNCIVSTMTTPPAGGGHIHEHKNDLQLFIVTQGSLTFDTGVERFTLAKMEAVLFEPGDPHSTANETDEDSVAVVITATAT